MYDRWTIEQIFTYHKPEEFQIPQFQAIRDKAKELAITIIDNTPICPEQMRAIDRLAEAVMIANQSIALNGMI
jgi:hypothetical protein